MCHHYRSLRVEFKLLPLWVLTSQVPPLLLSKQTKITELIVQSRKGRLIQYVHAGKRD